MVVTVPAWIVLNLMTNELYRWMLNAGAHIYEVGWFLFFLAITVFFISLYFWQRMIRALKFSALHDELTHLPNRRLFVDRLGQNVRLATRERKPFAIIYADMDNFKEVNDTLGHHFGDELIRQVVKRLKGSLRSSDTIARMAGDEFGLILYGHQTPGSVKVVAEKLLLAMEEPFIIDEIPFTVGLSMGISLFPEHGNDINTLMQRAEVAMFESKKLKNMYTLYDESYDQFSRESILLQNELRNAIKNEVFEVYFQPKINCESKSISGVEALARWFVPDQGMIPPNVFIPLAKRTNLIQKVTMVILKKSIQQASEWYHAGRPISLSVNITGENIQDPHFPEELAYFMSRYKFPSYLLELEITEDVIVDDIKKATLVCDQLRNMGVKLSIDDFGTGNSSISYLNKLPIRTLKIDQVFIREMRQKEDDLAIVRATIQLSKSLGLKVVAEGVEDLETMEVLHQMGCNMVQGYYISKPIPGNEMTEWIDESDWGFRDATLAEVESAREEFESLGKPPSGENGDQNGNDGPGVEDADMNLIDTTLLSDLPPVMNTVDEHQKQQQG